LTQRTTVSDIAGRLDALVPPALAEEWDNVGLQVGTPEAPVERLGVTLEVTEQGIQQAKALGVGLLVTHHPLILGGLHRVLRRERVGRLLYSLMEADMALYSAHTNLDASPLGPSAVLARQLELEEVDVMAPVRDLLKLTVFVPEDSLETVRRALGDAGAGHIGAYSHCTFSVLGTGNFLPSEDTSPYIGERGEVNAVSEARLETIIPRHQQSSLLHALFDAHPYEEPAYDLYPLANARALGMGRIGNLPHPMSLGDLVKTLARITGSDDLRYVGDEDARVQRVALVCGAGAKMWPNCLQRGAEVMVSGDISYHVAEDLLAEGLLAIDPGHAGSEAPFLGDYVAAIAEDFERAALHCEVLSMEEKVDPWKRADKG